MFRQGLLFVLALFGIIGLACSTATTRGGLTPGPTIDPSARFPGWRTDFTKHTVDFEEVISGAARDGIPALDAPQFLSVAEGDGFLAGREPVIAVSLNGEARAYPLQILIWHEIVNDTVGGVPLAVTFCPLCNSAIAFDRELNGVTYDFGVSGMLRNSDLIMYDRQTESWWQQFTGEAIAGELTGALLDVVPVAIVSWADFKSAYPGGLVLSRDTGFDRDYGRNPYPGYDSTNDSPFLFTGELDDRLAPAERVVGLKINGDPVAYPFSFLEERPVVEDTVGGEIVVVFFQPGTASALDQSSIAASRDVGAAGVFRPEADGRKLTFRVEDGEIVDNETGSKWNILGHAVDGLLRGAQLSPVAHGDYFWFAWAAFEPATRIWRP